MDVSQAIEKARKGEVLPIYFVGGEERLLVSRLCEAVRHAVVGKGPRGLAEDSFEGRGTTAATVLSACRTLPMMARRRLVTVRNVEQMAPPEQEALVPYFEKPEPTTVLLLVATQLDARRKLALEAKKARALFVAEHPNEDHAAVWVEREARARGVSMDAGAVESITLAIGPNLGQLADAIERLALYANGAPVDARMVDEVVVPVKEIPAFDLAEAIAQRNRVSALAVIVRLFNQRQEPLMVLGLLAWKVAQLAKARQFGAKPPEGRSLAAVLKMPPARVAGAVADANRWTIPQLHRAFRILAAADAALKGGRKGDEETRRLTLVETVLALCGAPGMGEPAA